MVTVINGTRGTGNIEQTQRVRDVSDKIWLLEPEAAPLTMILSKLNKKTSYSPKFEWYEDVLQPHWDAINNVGGYLSTDTVLVVDNESYFKTDDLVKVPRTGEIMYVVSVNTGAHTITVLRGYGTTAGAALVDDDPLLNLGNALEEGDNASAAITTSSVQKYNYCQVFSKTVDLTDIEDASKLYGGPDRAYQRKKKGIEMLRDLEKAFLFGEPYEDTGAKDSTLSHPRRLTGGLLYFASAQYTSAGGALTEAKFNEFLRDGFRYGSKTKFMFCSPLVLSAINQFCQGKIQAGTGDKEYGTNVMTYFSPHGTVKLVNEIPLEGAVYGGYGILVDMAELTYRYMNGLDIQLRTDIQGNNAHKIQDEYYGAVGLELHNPEKHRILKGVTS